MSSACATVQSIKNYLPASCVMFLLAANAAFAQSIPGLHVSYVSTNPHAAKAFEGMKNMMKDMCSQLLKQPFSVSGSASQTETVVVEQYFSYDGAYMAEYRDGYLGKAAAPCSLVVEPYKKILIYHIKQRALYKYDDAGKPPFWRKSKLPGVGAAGFTINAFNSKNAARGITPSQAGKASFLARICDTYALTYPAGSSSSCEWDPSAEGIKFPTRLSLYADMKDGNGDLIMETVVKAIDAKALIPSHLFQPPAEALR